MASQAGHGTLRVALGTAQARVSAVVLCLVAGGEWVRLLSLQGERRESRTMSPFPQLP